MAIQSNAFGRVRLSGEDAKKFDRQVRFGRPKAAASKNVAQGVELVKALRGKSDRLSFSLKK
ncbi:hypothetical protein [uncultured Brevundimonas sp.]|uniref:hypothetical protein n=1 Tax=uncultured Brevundimonas sp. TaxID=213418 RepID=UPI0025E655E9|nr:hypothetical protein [uncultured Brevundimonas sp.]